MGIGNLLSNDDERKELAKVGKEVITSDEYKLLYQNYEKQISGSDVSKEQVKKLKYDLLNALIEQKLLFSWRGPTKQWSERKNQLLHN